MTYVTDTCGREPLPKAKQRRLAVMARRGHAYVRRWARNELVETNMRLVASRAGTFGWSGLPYDDLAQAGVSGLIRAVEKYDPARGCALSTYATPWIDAEMRRYVDANATAIRQPVYCRRQARVLERARRRLEQEESREPTPEELCEETGIPLRHAERIAMTSGTRSLDEELGNRSDDPDALLALVGDDGVDVEAVADVAELWETVAAYVEDLRWHNERYPLVIDLYFVQGLTLEEIGREWGVSRQAVGAIKDRAVALLRWLCTRDDGLEETWRSNDCRLHKAAV